MSHHRGSELIRFVYAPVLAPNNTLNSLQREVSCTQHPKEGNALRMRVWRFVFFLSKCCSRSCPFLSFCSVSFCLCFFSFVFFFSKCQEKVERLRNARFGFADPKWKTVSSGGKGFVRGLLKKQPGFRWTAREALDHCSDDWAPALLVRTRQSFLSCSLSLPWSSLVSTSVVDFYYTWSHHNADHTKQRHASIGLCVS